MIISPSRSVSAKCSRVSRRSCGVSAWPTWTCRIISGSWYLELLEIDQEAYQVRRSGEEIPLTLREFELVRFLAQNAGQVFSREALLEKVWGYEYFGDVRTVGRDCQTDT